MLPRAIPTYEADRPNLRVITDGVHGWDSAVYNIDNAWRESGLLAKLGDHHGCTRIPFGWLDNKSVACNSGHRYCPQRNHPVGGWIASDISNSGIPPTLEN